MAIYWIFCLVLHDISTFFVEILFWMRVIFNWFSILRLFWKYTNLLVLCRGMRLTLFTNYLYLVFLLIDGFHSDKSWTFIPGLFWTMTASMGAFLISMVWALFSSHFVVIFHQQLIWSSLYRFWYCINWVRYKFWWTWNYEIVQADCRGSAATSGFGLKAF